MRVYLFVVEWYKTWYLCEWLGLACEQAPGEPERSPRPAPIASFSEFSQFRARPLALLAEFFFRPRREPVRRLH